MFLERAVSALANTIMPSMILLVAWVEVYRRDKIMADKIMEELCRRRWAWSRWGLDAAENFAERHASKATEE
jgi:hypothetical protein